MESSCEFGIEPSGFHKMLGNLSFQTTRDFSFMEYIFSLWNAAMSTRGWTGSFSLIILFTKDSLKRRTMYM
jgi:hypothetical protein